LPASSPPCRGAPRLSELPIPKRTSPRSGCASLAQESGRFASEGGRTAPGSGPFTSRGGRLASRYGRPALEGGRFAPRSGRSALEGEPPAPACARPAPRGEPSASRGGGRGKRSRSPRSWRQPSASGGGRGESRGGGPALRGEPAANRSGSRVKRGAGPRGKVGIYLSLSIFMYILSPRTPTGRSTCHSVEEV